MRKYLGKFIAVLVLGSSTAVAQISIDGFTDATNDRFTNDSSFIAAGFDLSGVGRTTGGQWGTLIGDNAVLTAQHARPGVGSSFQFFSSNDANGPSSQATVLRTIQVGSSDLSIAILDRNVSSAIQRYDFTTQNYSSPPPETTTTVDPLDGSTSTSTQTFFNPGIDIAGQRALIVGVSPTDRAGAIQIDQAVGENLVSSYTENIEFFDYENNDALIFERDVLGDPEHLANETFVQSGDSGAPTFLIDGNDLLLLGVNSFQINSGGFQATGVTFTGNADLEINSILAANAITAVPEPGAAALLAAMSVLSILRRKRSVR